MGLRFIFISLCKQLVFVLPLAWGLACMVKNGTGDQWLVWLAFPVTEIVSAIIACALMKKIYKREIQIIRE